MKKVLLILAHPDKSSLNGKIADIFVDNFQGSNINFKRINLGDLNFDLNLKRGYREVQGLEPDLKLAQSDILWADYLVFVFPIWWYSFPAILKGFIDRVFLPGFAFKYNNPNGAMPEKLLKGKKSILICTSGAPSFYYFLFGNLATKTLRGVLKFCGIKNIKTKLFGLAEKNNREDCLNQYQTSIKKIIKLIK
jgi:putative NADPH-quinone reductase